jgi:hypothetical protein
MSEPDDRPAVRGLKMVRGGLEISGPRGSSTRAESGEGVQRLQTFGAVWCA